MTKPHHDSLAATPLPPITDKPIPVGHLPVGTHLITVWADRPARRLTRVLLANTAGHAWGDATLHADTLTLTLPGQWPAADRATATCLIARLIYQDDTDALTAASPAPVRPAEEVKP